MVTRAERAVRAARAARAHEMRVRRVYGLPEGAYAALYAAQGGKCALCQRANGRTKRLAVDHDHACCKGPTSCGRCVRGLLCSLCNGLLGHMRDDIAFAVRVAEYLEFPPARPVLAGLNLAEVA